MFSFFVFCALGWCVVQAEVEIIFEDGEYGYINDEYLNRDACEIEVEDNSEYGTSLFTRLAIIKKFHPKFKIRVSLYGIEMGEYTNDMGVHVEAIVCELIGNTDSIAVPLLKAINLSPNDCPPEPGIYGNDAFVMDSQQGLPESFPADKYLLNITLFHEDVTFGNIRIYLTII